MNKLLTYDIKKLGRYIKGNFVIVGRSMYGKLGQIARLQQTLTAHNTVVRKMNKLLTYKINKSDKYIKENFGNVGHYVGELGQKGQGYSKPLALPHIIVRKCTNSTPTTSIN